VREERLNKSFHVFTVNQFSDHFKGLPKLPEKSFAQQVAERIAENPILLCGSFPYHTDMISDGLTTTP
jgi:hypothetical protein